jgi:glutamate synthase domain-containing protein 1
MCGIVGFLDKSGNRHAAVGRVLLDMLTALGRRGPDSAGVALYGDHSESVLVLRVKLGGHGHLETRGAQVKESVKDIASLVETSLQGEYVRLVVEYRGDPNRLERAVEAVGEDIEVVSMGRRLEVVKQVGSPENLETTYAISSFVGTHGIGHTRMSTESRVDLSHSQPFWAHGLPDMAVVHNGHITNYHKLRRRYEQDGHRFYTENDSEIIGLYLAEQMSRGASFSTALQSSLRDFDGSFSYLAATADSLGFVKDPFGFKPLLIAETPAYIALATEEVALQAALGEDFPVRELGTKQAQTWQVKTRLAA